MKLRPLSAPATAADGRLSPSTRRSSPARARARLSRVADLSGHPGPVAIDTPATGGELPFAAGLGLAGVGAGCDLDMRRRMGNGG